jgi:hypothetical protein
MAANIQEQRILADDGDEGQSSDLLGIDAQNPDRGTAHKPQL